MLFNYVPYENHSIIKPYKTCIFKESNYCYVVYHSTAVVKFNEFEIILNSNGWNTKTTKDRMNQTSQEYDLGFKIYQRNFKWWLVWDNKVYRFNDGMRIKSTKKHTALSIHKYHNNCYELLSGGFEPMLPDDNETTRYLRNKQD